MPGSCGAARASARAAKSAESGSRALTISAANRPKGGSPAARREAASAARKTVAVAGGERLHHRLIGHIGLTSSTCPALRPARRVRATLVQQLIVRSAAAQIAAGKAKSGVDTPTRVSIGNGGLWRRSGSRISTS